MRFLPAVISLGLLAAVAAAYDDPRSAEVLRFDCTTGVVRSETTLFGNGTLRLREGDVGEEEMLLSELGPDVFDGYLRRLRQESIGNDLAPPEPIGGLWTEQCVLTLEVPDGPSGSVEFGAFDSQSLPLSRLVAIARELVTLARIETYIEGLPRDYVPREGDILVHRDGTRYVVQGPTSDGKGVELTGLEQPLTIYLALEALDEQFLAVEETP